MPLQESQKMRQSAGQKAGYEYGSRLIRHFPDSNNTVQVCEECPEETKADYLRAHCITNNIGSKTYREGCYDGLGGATIDNKKYQKD
jgi:hypothetical protein